MNDPTSTMTVDICVCTYRRPQLESTLQSLARQTIDRAMVGCVIVADNDETPSAKALVFKLSLTFPYPLVYLHAPKQNISIARNACLDEAKSTHVAFIDDDEVADLHWIENLFKRQEETGATVILGPVDARYPAKSPMWMSKSGIHSIRPVWVRGVITTGYSSNVLFERTGRAISTKRFRLELGKSGGEDTTFFREIYESGGTIEFASDAVVHEEVSPERLSLAWLSKRYFRSGQSHGNLFLLRSEFTLLSRVYQISLALIKVSICWGISLLCVTSRRASCSWFLRGVLHTGTAARLFGVKEVTQYGTA